MHNNSVDSLSLVFSKIVGGGYSLKMLVEVMVIVVIDLR